MANFQQGPSEYARRMRIDGWLVVRVLAAAFVCAVVSVICHAVGGVLAPIGGVIWLFSAVGFIAVVVLFVAFLIEGRSSAEDS